MDDELRQALEIVKAQASVRNMTEDEITSMVQSLARKIKSISEPQEQGMETTQEPAVPPKKSIRERSVICLECGKTFKVLTKRHLATHGLTPEEYKEKWGFPKGTALIAKGLARERRKKMQDMKLWERRASAKSKK